jgi:DNA-binding transcriptional LysR family regulator
MASAKGLRRGTVELVTMPSPGIEPLSALTRRFTRRFPGITIDATAAFTPGEVIDKVRQGVCELGLVGASPAGSLMRQVVDDLLAEGAEVQIVAEVAHGRRSFRSCCRVSARPCCRRPGRRR